MLCKFLIETRALLTVSPFRSSNHAMLDVHHSCQKEIFAYVSNTVLSAIFCCATYTISHFFIDVATDSDGNQRNDNTSVFENHNINKTIQIIPA
jgi:hypothetical protein